MQKTLVRIPTHGLSPIVAHRVQPSDVGYVYRANSDYDPALSRFSENNGWIAPFDASLKNALAILRAKRIPILPTDLYASWSRRT